MGFQRNLRHEIFNHFFRDEEQGEHEADSIGLFSVEPDEEGAGGTELTGLGYVRQTIAWNAPAADAITNNGAISFGPAGEDWAPIVAWGLWNNAATPELILTKTLAAPITISNGGTLTIGDTDITVELEAA